MAHLARSGRNMRIVSVVALALLVLFATAVARVRIGVGDILGIVMLALFLVSVIAAGIWLAQRIIIPRSLTRWAANDQANSVLRRRYASGEISRTEYIQIKQDLETDA